MTISPLVMRNVEGAADDAKADSALLILWAIASGKSLSGGPFGLQGLLQQLQWRLQSSEIDDFRAHYNLAKNKKSLAWLFPACLTCSPQRLQTMTAGHMHEEQW